MPTLKRYRPAPMSALGPTRARCCVVQSLGRALCVGLCALTLGCATQDADPTPSAVLSHFLEAMDRSGQNDEARGEAYALLDTAAQQSLIDRAKQASLLGGREFEPAQMLAPGRFRLRFAPADHGGMRAQINGDQATVSVRGEDGVSRAEVPMVREAGQWRVKLSIPAMRRVEHEVPAAAGAASP